MLFIDFILVLLTACCSPHIAEPSAGVLLCADISAYTTFGLESSCDINTLEVVLLEPVCRNCLSFVPPARPVEFIEAELRGMAPLTREFFVVTAVLKADDPRMPLDLLMTGSGYARHYLLAKLFSPLYTEHLKNRWVLQANNPYTHDFMGLVSAEKHREKLQQVRQILFERAYSVLPLTFLQYAKAVHGENDSFDYAIYTLAKERHSQFFNGDITRMLFHWLHCDSHTLHWIIFVREYLKMVLLPGYLSDHRQRFIKKEIVEFVASKDDEMYLELLKSFRMTRSIRAHVGKHVEKYAAKRVDGPGVYDISPHFMYNYYRILHISSNGAFDMASTIFWPKFLGSPATFIRTKGVWSEDRAHFNKIGRVWLHTFFNTLAEKDSLAGMNRSTAMFKYVGMLEFGTFIEITTIITSNSCEALWDYMVGFLDKDSRKAYLSGARAMLGNSDEQSRLERQLERTVERITFLDNLAVGGDSKTQFLLELHLKQQKMCSRPHTGQEAPEDTGACAPKRLRENAPNIRSALQH
ncbi:hypothetical protein PAPHI01_1828 [Pancytospora philotis]|nr:hypothetical protein PAPHI01_1828 [Pancytospora philotis]